MTSWNIPSAADIKAKITSLPTRIKTSAQEFSAKNCLSQCRTSKRTIIFIVFVAIFLDNMLMTTVVPIIPNFLFQLEHPEDFARLQASDRDNSTARVTIDCSKLQYINQTDQLNVSHVGTSNSTTCITVNVTAEELYRQSELKLNAQSSRVGLLFASKAFVQLLINPLVGLLTNKIGYSIPLFSGFGIMFVSTIVFAFGENYWVLLVARAIQGAGSSCSSVSGMGMIADKYTDDRERGNAMAIALSGLALGVLLGPPFGGIMYDFLGKEAPFLILASLALLDGVLQIWALKPKRTPEQRDGPSIISLLKDPYIILAAGAITFANMGIAMLEPTLPQFMLSKMKGSAKAKWAQGVAFLPSSISYLIGTNLFGPLSHRIGRWLSALVGMVIIGVALFVIPFSKSIEHLMAPSFCLGFAIGMVDSSMLPTMGYLVDLRHVSIYGGVYAIADVAFCLGFAAGPSLGGVIEEWIGFKWMLWIIAIVNVLFAPLLYFLKNPPGNSEKVQLVINDKCPIKYVTYKQTSYDEEETISNREDEPLDMESQGQIKPQPAKRTSIAGGRMLTTASVSYDPTDSDDSGDTEGADSTFERDPTSDDSDSSETD